MKLSLLTLTAIAITGTGVLGGRVLEAVPQAPAPAPSTSGGCMEEWMMANVALCVRADGRVSVSGVSFSHARWLALDRAPPQPAALPQIAASSTCMSASHAVASGDCRSDSDSRRPEP